VGAAAAAAGTASFLYWLIHGTIDWFWEFPALGGPAFALLGLAAGLMPRYLSAARGRVLPIGIALAAVVPALSLIGPWLSQVQQNKAVSVWRADSKAAFDDLDSASSLNPLSATPKLLAGSIALRLDQRGASERYFREALERDPDDAYAHLELGALLSQRGRRAEAIATLERAHRLDPRDDLTALALHRVRRGKPVDIAAINRRLAARSAKLGR
jgi:tetratricopeptide (TPR) repeat protein